MGIEDVYRQAKYTLRSDKMILGEIRGRVSLRRTLKQVHDKVQLIFVLKCIFEVDHELRIHLSEHIPLMHRIAFLPCNFKRPTSGMG